MAGTSAKLTAAVEAYFAELGRIRATGGATGELSYHPALGNLLNAVGAALKPKVFCVGELADRGAGRPDFGLYAAKQVQKGRPREGQMPERGAVEVKPAEDDAWLAAESAQVSRYRERYGLVLATNLRDFVLVGVDAAGRPAKLETFRLAASADAFWARVEKPRAFARDAGAGLGEYLARALSHSAALAEPKDLAWLLASYARDGLARVEAAGEAPSLGAVRAALEEALGVRFEGETVTVAGVVRFAARTRAARQARNPRTGEPVAVPAARCRPSRPQRPFATRSTHSEPSPVDSVSVQIVLRRILGGPY